MVKRNNKGQMKIQQTAFMLIALTLFFALIGLFVLTLYMSNMKGEAQDLKAKQSKLLVSKLSASPEFACGTSFSNAKLTDCVDADKVMVLMQNSSRYRHFWGVDDIKIRRLYPSMDGEIKCTLSTYPNCNIYDILEEENVGIYESNFVNLCRKEKEGDSFYDKCELALLMVSYNNSEIR